VLRQTDYAWQIEDIGSMRLWKQLIPAEQQRILRRLTETVRTGPGLQRPLSMPEGGALIILAMEIGVPTPIEVSRVCDCCFAAPSNRVEHRQSPVAYGNGMEWFASTYPVEFDAEGTFPCFEFQFPRTAIE